MKEHYRRDCEYDADCFKITKGELDAMHAAIATAKGARGAGEDRLGPALKRARAGFIEAMDDDFDTRKAVLSVVELTTAVSEVPRISRDEGAKLLGFYRDVSRVLGILEDAVAPAPR